MYKLFMEFENPTKESVQGFAVHGDIGFVLYHTGVCAAYDLAKKNPKPLGVFKLGSYNEGSPDNRYTNHANSAMFGPILPGEKYPLLYVSAGNSGEIDEKGYIAYCAVEQIRKTGGVFSSQTVQRIYYKNDGIAETPFETPAWGWPFSLVDVEHGWYYLFSARYRTRKEYSKADNAYIVTKFALPSPDSGDMTLYPRDIKEQFLLPFNVFATQGGTLFEDKIWYMFGFGTEAYPNALRVIDLQHKKYQRCEDLSNTPFRDQEVECCAFYDGKLLINTQDNKIYAEF